MCFGLSTLGAGAKTRLESRIKKSTPHCVCRPINWTVARSELHIGGRAAWPGHTRENFYDRFPYDAQANVTSEHKGIWGLSKCSAGEFVGFRIAGNVTSLWVNYSVYAILDTHYSDFSSAAFLFPIFFVR